MLRGARRDARARALAAHGARRDGGHAPLRRRLVRPRDHVRVAHGRRGRDRDHAARGRPRRPGPPHHVHARMRRGAARVGRALRLRRGGAVGHARRRPRPGGDPRRGGPGLGPAARLAAAARERPPPRRRVRPARAGERRPVPHVDPVLGSRAARAHGARAHRLHTDRVGAVGARRDVPGPAPRGRGALAPGAAAPHRLRDGRDRRRRDHVAARGLRRRTELGLPLLLAARRSPDHRGAARAGLPERDAPVARLAAAGRRGRPGRPADHVPPRRRPGPAGTDARPPARLRRLAARADRQRRGRPGPERRARRGHVRARGGT